MTASESPSSPLQIITEGVADQVFFEKLLASRGIAGFQARCARSNSDNRRCAGKSGFPDSLRALLAINQLKPGTVKGIILAVDSDCNPAQSFEEMRGVWKACRPMHPHPEQPLEIMDVDPAMCILTVPWSDRTGNLDTLLYESTLQSHSDLVVAVDRFCEATKHRNGIWSDGTKGKMRLRCVIAASHSPDPGISLSFLIQGSKCPFDFASTCFDRLSDFLLKFKERVLK